MLGLATLAAMVRLASLLLRPNEGDSVSVIAIALVAMLVALLVGRMMIGRQRLIITDADVTKTHTRHGTHRVAIGDIAKVMVYRIAYQNVDPANKRRMFLVDGGGRARMTLPPGTWPADEVIAALTDQLPVIDGGTISAGDLRDLDSSFVPLWHVHPQLAGLWMAAAVCIVGVVVAIVQS